jgi:hypothetical protein
LNQLSLETLLESGQAHELICIPSQRGFVKSYTFRRQNYFVFQMADATAAQPFVHFLWGKFDFRCTLKTVEKGEAEAQPKQSFSSEDGNFFALDSFQNLYRNEWYDFVKPTAHGLRLEETLWQRGDQLHYAEYPQDLRDIACSICAAELGLKWLHPTI